MRVLLSAFACHPSRGSEPGTGWHWAGALADLGHEVTVLTVSNNREEILARCPQGVNFRFIDIPIPRVPRFPTLLWVYDTYGRWQLAALREIEAQAQQYDVAHHVTYGGLHLGSALWRLPIPLVYGPVGGGQTAPASYWRYFGRGWPSEVFRTASTGPLLKLNRRCQQTVENSALTLVCNSATAAACQRLGATDVRYMLADGLSSEWLADARPQPPGIPVVLWVGTLLPRKAPTLAVQAFAELRRAMSARLIIAGDGPLRAQVCATIERLGLTEDVQMLGKVPLEDVRSLYDSASVLLFTSLRESFGAPFIEALGRGLPAVALDLAGIADADVGLAALKVALPPKPDDLPRRLASAVQTTLCDREWESRSAAAIKWAADWTWAVKAAAATQIYQEIAGSRSLHRSLLRIYTSYLRDLGRISTRVRGVGEMWT
jgi:glycosyltransferase involved in cell wall biosynthesis